MKKFLVAAAILFSVCAIASGLILMNSIWGRLNNSNEIIIEDERAAFGPETETPATLNLLVEGNGTIEVQPYQASYKAGTRVTFVAHPQPDWEFVSWKGDVKSKLVYNKEITLPLFDGKYNIIAVFKPKQ